MVSRAGWSLHATALLCRILPNTGATVPMRWLYDCRPLGESMALGGTAPSARSYPVTASTFGFGRAPLFGGSRTRTAPPEKNAIGLPRSFDHPVGAQAKGLRNSDAEGFGRLNITIESTASD
jgi:hypothetical protein